MVVEDVGEGGEEGDVRVKRYMDSPYERVKNRAIEWLYFTLSAYMCIMNWWMISAVMITK